MWNFQTEIEIVASVAVTATNTMAARTTAPISMGKRNVLQAINAWPSSRVGEGSGRRISTTTLRSAIQVNIDENDGNYVVPYEICYSALSIVNVH